MAEVVLTEEEKMIIEKKLLQQDLMRKEAFNSKRIANLTRKYICPQCDELPKGRRCIFADNHDEDLCDKSGYKKGFAYED